MVKSLGSILFNAHTVTDEDTDPQTGFKKLAERRNSLIGVLTIQRVYERW
jgi:hypothetical protein